MHPARRALARPCRGIGLRRRGTNDRGLLQQHPGLQGERLCGIFTERDLLTRVVAAGLDPPTTRLGDVMTADPDTIEASAPIIEAIRRMDEFCYRHMPVLERGRLIGVVSWRDLPYEDRARIQPELEQRHTLAERMW